MSRFGGFDNYLPEAFPWRATTIGSTLYKCLVYLEHFSASSLSCQNRAIPFRSLSCTVQVRDKRPTHTQNARTIFAQTRVEKRVEHTRLRVFDARISFCYSLS